MTFEEHLVVCDHLQQCISLRLRHGLARDGEGMAYLDPRLVPRDVAAVRRPGKKPPIKKRFVAVSALVFEKIVSGFTGPHKRSFHLLVYRVP